MRIKKIELKNFKRFTDLVIDDIPDKAKLVLLIGSNGSGKSSVFDAFEFLNLISKKETINNIFALGYLPKNKNEDFKISVTRADNLQIEASPTNRINIKEAFNQFSFYGRTSFRQTPRLTRTRLGETGRLDIVNKDSDRPKYYIDLDRRFENDVEYITGIILRDIFRGSDSKEQIKERYIQPLNNALENIFGQGNGTKLQLIEIIPPLEGNIAQITFKKGTSEIHYNLLSAGEKEVINILFNLLTRAPNYQDSIYFLDEIDLHLHTELQFRLIKEITENWISDNCQLWTASHSLGFIEYARQTEDAVIIDFNDFDFDAPRVLIPQSKDRLDIYEIAVPKSLLFEMMKDKKIIVCENQNDEYYNLLALPDLVFVGVRDSRDVFLSVKRDSRYHSLRDRDFLSDTEIERIKNEYPNHHILRYYDFENYIYHPDNLAELSPPGFDKDAYIQEIRKQKNERYHYILPNIVSARQSYEEFKTNDKLRDANTDSIVDDFKSDDFEKFYKFFDMKVQFNKSFLSPFNLRKENMVKTKWFKSQVEEVLK